MRLGDLRGVPRAGFGTAVAPPAVAPMNRGPGEELVWLSDVFFLVMFVLAFEVDLFGLCFSLFLLEFLAMFVLGLWPDLIFRPVDCCIVAGR